MKSTFIPPDVLPHFDAVCDWMASLPAEGADEVGTYFKRLGDVNASSKRDLAKFKSMISSVDAVTVMRQMLWGMRIEPTDNNVVLATLIRERCRKDPAHLFS